MKVSEAIAELQKTLAQEGDLEMVVVTDVDGQFCIDRGRTLDVIEFECGSPDCKELHQVCAFLEEPDSSQVEYPTLKRIK